MRKDIPKEFLEEYEAKRGIFQNALEQITGLLKSRLSHLAARTNVRGRITDFRIKRPVKLWNNAKKAGLNTAEAFIQIEDILGLRIVCNNLSDIDHIVEMIGKDCSILSVLEIKDMISTPVQTGYRATHVRTLYDNKGVKIPCEIQVRTLAQDTWARLSRADLYGKNVPLSIQRISKALSTQLSAIDEIGQLIRDELNQCPHVAEDIKDSDCISPQRLALLYKHKFEEDIYEWTLVGWVNCLNEAEIEKVGEVRRLLNDSKMRKNLDKISNQVRGFPLENSEWVIYSSLVFTEVTTAAGIKAVKRRIQNELDEIVATSRHEALSEMSDTLEEFIKMLQSGYIPTEALMELGGIQSCYRCGASIFRPEQAAEAVLEYYGNPDIDTDLESLFEGPSGEDTLEVESVDFSGACQHCGYQMSKDD